MFKTYLKSACRQLFKNRLFSVINITGLSVGLASLMTLSVLLFQYLTTNDNVSGIDQMYYLKTVKPSGSQSMATTYPLLGEIVRECPEVEAATHMQQWYSPWLKYQGKEFQETTDFVDTSYFKVFQFHFRYGNPQTALKDKYDIVFSAEIAEKIFGKDDPVGKIIMADDSLPLRVAGVLAPIPTNTTIRPTVLLSTALLQDNPGFKQTAGWYNVFAVNYLRLKKGSAPAQLDAQIAAIVKSNYAPELKRERVQAVPFRNIKGESGHLTGMIMKGAVGAGLFILLIILANLVNLNIAATYARAREVAVRQIMGSTKGQIILQFCLENGLIVVVAVTVAWFLFLLLLLPLVNDLLGNRIGAIGPVMKNDYLLFAFFGMLSLLITLLGAIFPAWRLIKLPVADAVKGKLSKGNYRNSTFRNLFIVLQFALAVILICTALVFSRQVAFMKSFALGFNQQNLAIVKLDLSYLDPKSADVRFKTLIHTLKSNPHVKGVSTSRSIPTAYDDNYNSFYDPATGKKILLRYTDVDAGYFPTYQIPFLQGRNFDDALTASEHSSVIINETAMKAFGWKNAIGKRLKEDGSTATYTVIGVTRDFHFEDLQNGIQPVMQSYTGPPSLDNRFLTIRIVAGQIKPIMERLRRSFQSIPSRRAFSFELMSSRIDQQYGLFDGMLKATDYVATLTIIIACMGLFGLITLFARQRAKEIAIRKVLGADVIRLLRVLSGNFIMLIGIAMLIGAPIAWFVMSNWLQNFAYRVRMDGWVFLLGSLTTLLLSVITVGLQTLKTARANPVDALRAE